jgi:hypothetical protein
MRRSEDRGREDEGAALGALAVRRSLDMRVWWPLDCSGRPQRSHRGRRRREKSPERPVSLEPTDRRPSGPAVEPEVSLSVVATPRELSELWAKAFAGVSAARNSPLIPWCRFEGSLVADLSLAVARGGHAGATKAAFLVFIATWARSDCSMPALIDRRRNTSGPNVSRGLCWSSKTLVQALSTSNGCCSWPVRAVAR